jgi:hypothetical protein
MTGDRWAIDTRRGVRAPRALYAILARLSVCGGNRLEPNNRPVCNLGQLVASGTGQKTAAVTRSNGRTARGE